MSVEIIVGDCLENLSRMPGGGLHCCVTSPPYFGLRDYGVAGQMGLEATPEAFVEAMVAVFREVHRVLRDDGTLWLNIGDSYSSNPGTPSKRGVENDGYERRNRLSMRRAAVRSADIKPKDLIGIPWMLAFALRSDGWHLRQEIIWSKNNPMPESVRDRCTRSHEQIFLLSKAPRYYYDAEAITEPVSPNTHARLSQNVMAQVGSERAHAGGKTNGPMRAVGRKRSAPGSGVRANDSFQTAVCLPVERRNKRSVWEVSTQPFKEAHFATFPPALIEPCILAGCPKGGTVLDPFGGAGTTGLVADRLQRNAVLIELNPAYADIARRRIDGDRGALLDAMEAA